jgi:hypothetical protein
VATPPAGGGAGPATTAEPPFKTTHREIDSSLSVAVLHSLLPRRPQRRGVCTRGHRENVASDAGAENPRFEHGSVRRGYGTTAEPPPDGPRKFWGVAEHEELGGSLRVVQEIVNPRRLRSTQSPVTGRGATDPTLDRVGRVEGSATKPTPIVKAAETRNTNAKAFNPYLVCQTPGAPHIRQKVIGLEATESLTRRRFGLLFPARNRSSVFKRVTSQIETISSGRKFRHVSTTFPSGLSRILN